VHADALIGVESDLGLVIAQGAELRSDLGVDHRREAVLGVERSIPRDVPVGGERDGGVALHLGPPADVFDQGGAESLPTVLGDDAQLFEVGVPVDGIDDRITDGDVVGIGHQPDLLGPQVFGQRRDALGLVGGDIRQPDVGEHGARPPLDITEQLELVRPRRPDLRRHTPAVCQTGLTPRRSGRSSLVVLGLSQVIFGVRDLEAATERFRALGFEVLDGGLHPGVGTANRVIPLGEEYLELLGVVAPEEARASEYGRALLRATERGDRIVRWSLRTDDIEGLASRLDLEIESRRRVRPDGEMLTWRAAGLALALADAPTPFFMQWDRAEQYPGRMRAEHPNGARRVSGLWLTPSDDDRLRAWIEGADAPIERAPEAEPGIWSVGVETADGELRLRA
jgi:hypothetical protein